MSTVVLQVRITPELLEKVRVESGGDVSVWVRGLLEAAVGMEAPPATPKKAPEACKKVSVEVLKAVAVPEENRPLRHGRDYRWCGRCARQTEEWKVIDGLAVCPKCQ